MNRPATIAPLVDQAPRPLREYVEQLERVAGDDFRVDRIGASHSHDPSTSSDAARLNFPRSGNQRRRVLEALAARSTGATFEQLIADTEIKSAAKRLTELKAGGWAFATGSTRPTSQGGSAEVYLASQRALQELQRDRRADQTAGGGDSASFHDAGSVRDEGCAPAPLGARPSADHEPAPLFGDEPEREKRGPYDVMEAA